MEKLGKDFYERDDVVKIARELLGKIIETNIDGHISSGVIVETEAYVANIDKASHAFAGKRTQRNESMYADAATVYVYICYGMHQMLNVVTNKKNIPDAVLIRAIDPLKGIDIMLNRTGKAKLDHSLTKGPGNVGKAMGISKIHSGKSIVGNEIYIYIDGKSNFLSTEIGISKRIGVKNAGKDALLPYRFYIKGNKYVSGSPSK